jgi:glycosyltransferase involved in cell wall biosynthesis
VRLLVHALSIGSMSGEHVVYGFLREVLRTRSPGHEVLILSTEGQPLPADLIELGVSTIAVPNRLRLWFYRAAWELLKLPGLLRKYGIDRVLNVSGGITPFISVPQVSLCMNPWCYVPGAQSGWKEKLKAWMQRRSYRYAFSHAEHMIYISSHLRELYRQDNTDLQNCEAHSTIAYVGLDDGLFGAIPRLQSIDRQGLSILSVSAWARWKGLETTLQALRLLRDSGTAATLTVAGPWPDEAYKARIDQLITELGLQDAVKVLGKVPVEKLYQLYAGHQVFCLMSTCESFGIPAAEAMAFGTPVVSTDCSAIAEVCAGAGRFGPTADAEWTARSLAELLTDQKTWHSYSVQAGKNAGKLRWPIVSQPLHTVLFASPLSDSDPHAAVESKAG